MDLAKKRRDSAVLSKKDKKLKKLINKSDSDSDESEHELSHYLNDRVKLMKEVLKIIKPKKIKTMAPECMKKLDIQEINSMLLEELLGISNKRLKYIFNGQNLEEDSSSTDPEAEQEPIDVISLDDISDDDFVIDLDSENESKQKYHRKHKIKIKEECKRKKIKKEKHDKSDKPSKKCKEPEDKMNEENLMSVLELLELQARARAIRSQLALENSRKAEEQEKNASIVEESDNDDTVIIESPKNIEIIITSSESENEGDQKDDGSETNGNEKDSSARIENDKRIDTENNDRMGTKSSKKDENVSEDINEAQTEKKCSTKNKIMNIESVIISPAKGTIISGDNKKDNKISTNNTNSSTRQAIEMQNNVADESDGIIINMEQYEIDCIISD